MEDIDSFEDGRVSKLGVAGYEELPPQCWNFSPLFLSIADEIRQEIRPVAFGVCDEELLAVVAAGILEELSLEPSSLHFVHEVQHILLAVSEELNMEKVASIMESARCFVQECNFALFKSKADFSVYGFKTLSNAHSFVWNHRFVSRLVSQNDVATGLRHFCMEELKEFALQQTRVIT